MREANYVQPVGLVSDIDFKSAFNSHKLNPCPVVLNQNSQVDPLLRSWDEANTDRTWR